MIKANELRIGNYVQDEWGLIVLLRNAFIHYLKDGEFKNVEPIPITEKWLLKLGFNEVVDEMTELFKFRHFKLPPKNFLFSIYNDDDGKEVMSAGSATGVISIQYVHQLQNLYFALTGTELTIKENVQA